MVPRVVGVRAKGKKNEKNGVKKDFKHSSPEFYCSWAVLVFSKNHGFATTLSNLICMTTLRFFDVPDSFFNVILT